MRQSAASEARGGSVGRASHQGMQHGAGAVSAQPVALHGAQKKKINSRKLNDFNGEESFSYTFAPLFPFPLRPPEDLGVLGACGSWSSAGATLLGDIEACTTRTASCPSSELGGSDFLVQQHSSRLSLHLS